MTFKEVLEGIETGHPEVLVWAPLENLPVDELLEMIVNCSEDIESVVNVVPVPRRIVKRLIGLLEEHTQYDDEDEVPSLEAQCMNELKEVLDD